MSQDKKKKLFVHIGMYKTGSTSIQYFLNGNTDRLYDLDFHFPATGRHPRAYVQHQLLSEAFSKTDQNSGDFKIALKPDKRILVESLRHEIAIADRSSVILSSELFCLLPRESIEEFCKEFSNFEIIPIIFLRNYSDLADSSYHTVVMSNSTTKTFDEMGFHSWPRVQNVFELCKNWRDCAGSGKIGIFNFDHQTKRDVVEVFCEALELPIKSLSRASDQNGLNRSLSVTQVLIKQSMVVHGAKVSDADGLVAQLGRLDFSEKQTHVPPQLRADMNEAYLRHIGELLNAGLVSPDEFNLQALREKMDTPRVFVKNLVHAVFAIGRAIARQSNKS